MPSPPLESVLRSLGPAEKLQLARLVAELRAAMPSARRYDAMRSLPQRFPGAGPNRLCAIAIIAILEAYKDVPPARHPAYSEAEQRTFLLQSMMASLKLMGELLSNVSKTRSEISQTFARNARS